VNKQESYRFNIERLNFKKLKTLEGNDQYGVEVSNRFAALEVSDSEYDSKVLGKRLEGISKFQPKRV
jgi:hypothetical protein